MAQQAQNGSQSEDIDQVIIIEPPQPVEPPATAGPSPSPATPSAKLTVSSILINQLDPLAVSFSLANTKPTASDWIGVYCIDDERVPLPDNQYIDWRYTGNVDAATFQFGPLVNMRCSWQFRYFAARNGTNVKLGESLFVRFRQGNKEPLQVHLSSTEVASEMRVMWTSESVVAPTVSYGTNPAWLTQTELATGTSYRAHDMCQSPATTVAAQFFRDPGTIYAAVMRDLVPEQTYYYKIGDASPGGTTSQVFSFKTPPAPGAPNRDDKPMSYFVYGDLGDWNIKATGPKPEQRTATTIELMRRDMDTPGSNFVAAMHNGDISYAMGRTYLWDQFGALVQPVAAEIPYMVGIGNHEYCHTSGGEKDPSGAPGNGYHPPEGNYGADSQGECGVPFNKRFIMPANGNKVFWWSVEYGLTHHTQISSEHDYTPGSPMYTWLVNDLKSVDRKKTPWLFLYLHRPMYTSEMYDSDHKLSLFIRKNLEPLLAQYKVDVVFSGHYHAYELTCPVYNETCRTEPLGTSSNGLAKAKAPVHIMVGSAGADVDNVGYFDVPWRVAAELNYGYGRMHVYNATHAQFEFVRNEAKAVTSSSWIISDHNWSVSMSQSILYAQTSSACALPNLGMAVVMLSIPWAV
uniref:Purple acid phosphatase n=1 Tax=Globisporangium ultimum (strain ATCC 200006 / CBS 805.95 / DAOM BR144) TaxID=431595 RepID=K3WC55_GLOUD